MASLLPRHDAERRESPSSGDDASDFFATYGAWAPLTVDEIASLMRGFSHPWWLVGGYAIEAFTGVVREHEDADISFFPDALADFRRHVGSRYHLWSNDGGTFRLIDDVQPEPLQPLAQVWLRANAQSPWVLDVVPSPSVDGRWQSKRDPAHVGLLEDVTWIDGGVRCANPEIVLLFKARQDRAKDRADLEDSLPLLSAEKRRWLAESIGRLYPGHPWLERLSPG